MDSPWGVAKVVPGSVIMSVLSDMSPIYFMSSLWGSDLILLVVGGWLFQRP